jgi:hypothetical protein
MTIAIVILLTVGLVLSLANVQRAAEVCLSGGLILLMATPVWRLLWALFEEIRAREWRFVALGVVVIGLLFGSYLLSR